MGYDFAHALTDDHSRLAYVELLGDERAATVTAFIALEQGGSPATKEDVPTLASVARTAQDSADAVQTATRRHPDAKLSPSPQPQSESRDTG